MVYPVSNINPELNNHQIQFENGTAIGMPPINFADRKISPPTNINTINNYSPEYNPVRRINKNLAPSSVLTEAYLKSRISLNPVFLSNEAITRYNMISKIFFDNNDIKTNLLKVA